jgi:hypothetical protein
MWLGVSMQMCLSLLENIESHDFATSFVCDECGFKPCMCSVLICI